MTQGEGINGVTVGVGTVGVIVGVIVGGSVAVAVLVNAGVGVLTPCVEKTK